MERRRIVRARSVRSSVCRKEGREEEEKKERVRLPLPSSFHISSYRSLLGRGRECKCALCFTRNWKIVYKCRRENWIFVAFWSLRIELRVIFPGISKEWQVFYWGRKVFFSSEISSWPSKSEKLPLTNTGFSKKVFLPIFPEKERGKKSVCQVRTRWK